MPSARLPFGMNQESGLSELAGAAPIAMNVIIDAKGAVRRRPGIAEYDQATSAVIDSAGIDGLHVTHGGKLFATAFGDIKACYRVSAASAALLGSFYGPQRTVFAETEAILAMASGHSVQKIVLSTDVLTALNGGATGAPPRCSHIIFNSSRLITNRVDDFHNQLFYSDVAAGSSYTGHETWTGGDSGFVSADARPDPVISLHENSNEVFPFGSSSLQILAPDAELVYASTTTRETGCSAPYSVIKVDQGFAWLDHMRRFVAGDGRSNTPISKPIQQTLDDMTDVSDCFGYRVKHGATDVLVWTFPTDGRTFTFSASHGWGQWSGWSDSVNNWTRFGVSAHVLRADRDENVVGTWGGKIGVLETSATTDLGDRINAFVTTGFLSHDNDRLKLSKALRLTFKNVSASSGTSALLSWRDDQDAWSAPLQVDLSVRPVVEFRGLGTYRRRQWRLEFSGSEEFELVSVEEDYDVLSV